MIKIFSAKITDFTQADYTYRYSLLERAIRSKIDAKKHDIHKKQSLAGYILLYHAIFELYGKTEVEINFNRHGKPFCDFCFFNISHSGERVVCVIGDEVVGVDVQKIKNIAPKQKYKFFNTRENDYVNADPNLVSTRYTEIFTKKEAAVKMLGESLSYSGSIDTFSSEYCFETQIDNEFVVTVCKKGSVRH